MAAFLSPIGNGWQFFTNQGVILAGGKINTYVAGTTTPQATYTDSTQVTPNANPIILDSTGRPTQEIWLTGGINYKFILTDSSNVTIGTWDNLSGINDITGSVSQSEWVVMALTPTFVSTTQFTLPGNQTALLPPNRRVKIQISAGLVYGFVTASSFAASTTTVTVLLDSGNLDSGISSVSYGILSPVNPSFPAIPDNLFKLSGSADVTKLLVTELDGITTGTTRTWTAADKNIKVAGLVDIRSYLAGCTLSTAGSSTTMSISAGTAVDSTNVSGMQLSAISKTTAAWVVGSAAGGLDTGSIANSTWYHFYVIQRVDTGVVDVVFSTNATSPTMPTNYTLFRRIGSGLTNGSAQWVNFTQNGDDFNWVTPVLDVNALATSATAALATLSVPLGVKVKAYFNSSINTTIGNNNVYFSDPAVTDQAASTTAAPLASTAGNSSQSSCYTNTSSQIRHRENNTTGNLYVATLGWTDTRGRNA